VNWYKIAQNYYTDIGHYDYADDIDPQGDKKITLWVSNLDGGNFQMKQTSTRTGVVHGEIFDLRVNENYWGRHDPFQNKVSIQLPEVIPVWNPSISPDDIPNRLVDRLMKEFPGASIYAYGALDNDKSVTQII